MEKLHQIMTVWMCLVTVCLLWLLTVFNMTVAQKYVTKQGKLVDVNKDDDACLNYSYCKAVKAQRL
jgi:hypothetical protein